MHIIARAHRMSQVHSHGVPDRAEGNIGQAQVQVTIDLPEDRDIYKPMASRYAFLAILDTLAMTVARLLPKIMVDNLRRIRASLPACHGRTRLSLAW